MQLALFDLAHKMSFLVTCATRFQSMSLGQNDVEAIFAASIKC